MFDNSSGLFHFVFANQDDDFYTPSYIKMKFRPYLLFQLKDKYSHIYFFEKAFDISNGSYLLHTISGDNLEIINLKKQKESLFGILKRKKNSAKDCHNDVSVKFSTTSISHIEKEQLAYYFLRMLELAENNHNTAVVMPIEAFSRLCYERNSEGDTYKQILSKLINLHNRRGNTNIIILTSSVNASENDTYFLNFDLVRGTDKTEISQAGVFFNKKLFPEICDAFNNTSTEKIPKLVFTYILLRNSLGDRFQAWNELSYHNILIAVKYVFMHNMTFDKTYPFYPPEIYAAVIWAWYENEEFREKYKKIIPKMPDNIFRKVKIITNIIENQTFSPDMIKKIVDSECIVDVEEFRRRWPADEKAICITNGVTEENMTALPKIVQELIRFRNLLRTHEHRFSDEEVKTVSSLIRYFNRPSYQSSINKADLPHILFRTDENQEIMNEVLCNLEQKQEWNVWDDCSVQILQLLFKSCRMQANQKCQVDLWNEIGQVTFKKCIEGLNYCLKMSKEESYNREKACDFLLNISKCIDSCDKKQIEDFFII